MASGPIPASQLNLRDPSKAPRELRDKAAFALLCLTGIRVAALVSLSIKHINLSEKSVTQNPREVATKYGKSIDTFFARGFEGAEAALAAWLTYLDEIELYGPDDPLFPATDLVANSNTGFAAQGFKRCPWKSTEPVRKIVRGAFERAGLPNYGAPMPFATCWPAMRSTHQRQWLSSSPTLKTSVTRTC